TRRCSSDQEIFSASVVTAISSGRSVAWRSSIFIQCIRREWNGWRSGRVGMSMREPSVIWCDLPHDILIKCPYKSDAFAEFGEMVVAKQRRGCRPHTFVQVTCESG